MLYLVLIDISAYHIIRTLLSLFFLFRGVRRASVLMLYLLFCTTRCCVIFPWGIIPLQRYWSLCLVTMDYDTFLAMRVNVTTTTTVVTYAETVASLTLPDFPSKKGQE